MAKLLQLEKLDAFKDSKYVRPQVIPETVLQRVKNLSEKAHIEPFLRQILIQPYSTPHGPTELADILCTTQIEGCHSLAAFVIKGKSFKQITDKHVAHQFVKATSIPLLQVIVFVAVGDIQDNAIRCLAQEAQNKGCDFLIVDRVELSRLLISYGKICPYDGRILSQQRCECGFVYDRERLFFDLLIKTRKRTAIGRAAISEGRVVRGHILQGRPYVSAFVCFPRLRANLWVNFLIDTGADETLISPFDTLKGGIKPEQLGKTKEIASLGGILRVFSEPALVLFQQEDGVTLVYEAEVDILQELAGLNKGLPSILGRDIIGKMDLHMETGKRRKMPSVFLLPRVASVALPPSGKNRGAM